MQISNICKLLYFLMLGTFLIFSCKNEASNQPEPDKMELLSSTTSKTWQIEKLYINDTMYVLSPIEKQYTVTYNADSTYVDSDGMGGKYLMDINGTKLIETLTLGGSGKFTYNIETLNASTLIMRLIDNGQSNPNIQYHYRAK